MKRTLMLERACTAIYVAFERAGAIPSQVAFGFKLWLFSRTISMSFARRANHFGFTKIVSSQKLTEIKNISLFSNSKQGYINAYPVPIRGAYHDRHERGTGSGGRW
jgi:hypothetical protein